MDSVCNKFERVARDTRDIELGTATSEIRLKALSEIRSEENEHLRILRLNERQHEESEERAAKLAAVQSHQSAEEAIPPEQLQSQELAETDGARSLQLAQEDARAYVTESRDAEAAAAAAAQRDADFEAFRFLTWPCCTP